MRCIWKSNFWASPAGPIFYLSYKDNQGSVHRLAIYMYDTENIKFKFSQLRRHLIKLTEQTVQGFL